MTSAPHLTLFAPRPVWMQRPILPVTAVYQVKVVRGVTQLLATLRFEGEYKSSREAEGTTRIIISFRTVFKFQYVRPGNVITRQIATQRNKELLMKFPQCKWLPRYYIRLASGSSPQGFLKSDCCSTYRTRGFSGFGGLPVITLNVSVNITRRESVSIVADAESTYSQAFDLYVATIRPPIMLRLPEFGSSFATAVEKFESSSLGAAYESSEEIAGSLLNQFFTHEYTGNFVVTTTPCSDLVRNRNLSARKISALETRSVARKNGLTSTRLVKISEFRHLEEGDSIFPMRHIEDREYVVKFRVTDGLYVIYLLDKKNWTLKGQLKNPGFPTYMHPMGGGRLLGVRMEEI